jgi:hypothetical protein
MAQINVSEGREWVATGSIQDGRFEMEAGNISADAVVAINEQLAYGDDFGEVRDGGRELSWKAQRPGE